jgi:hypothetical protein
MIPINTIIWESPIYNKEKWNINIKNNDFISVGSYII